MAFPSYSRLQNGIDLYYETVRPSSEDLVSAVIAFRDEHLYAKARAMDLEAAKKREEAARRRMLQERAEIGGRRLSNRASWGRWPGKPGPRFSRSPCRSERGSRV